MVAAHLSGGVGAAGAALDVVSGRAFAVATTVKHVAEQTWPASEMARQCGCDRW